MMFNKVYLTRFQGDSVGVNLFSSPLSEIMVLNAYGN